MGLWSVIHDSTYTANDLTQYNDLDRQGTPPKEYLCYDDDGSLIRDGKAGSTCPGTDGLFTYAWDAEDRLIEIEPVTPDTQNRDTKLRFRYDYMGRRVLKDVYTYNGSGWDLDETLKSVYDGWNVVLVLDDEVAAGGQAGPAGEGEQEKDLTVSSRLCFFWPSCVWPSLYGCTWGGPGAAPRATGAACLLTGAAAAIVVGGVV
jgi:hypothetical protein